MARLISHTKQHHSIRRGVAVVELAVCLPVLVLIVVATVESSAMIFLQQSLSIAAYEGSRVALTQGASATDVRTQSELILQARDIQSATVTVTPSNLDSALPGDWCKVQVSAPFGVNSLMGGWLFAGHTLESTVEMMKERGGIPVVSPPGGGGDDD